MNIPTSSIIANKLRLPVAINLRDDSCARIASQIALVLTLSVVRNGHDCYAFDVNASPSIIASDQNLGSPSHRRISMNLSMLIDAKRCILLVPNSDKRKIVERAFKDKQLPLHFLLNQERTKIEFSDIDF